MAKPTNKPRSSIQKIEIREVPSAYRAGTWSQVAAHITWCFHGTRVSLLEERSAEAVGHRLVAHGLEATPPTEAWGISTDVLTSYRDITVVRVGIELANGDAAEMERAKALLTEITAQLK